MKKVDRNLGKIRPNKINGLKKTVLFFDAFLSMYLVFKTVAPMRFVGFRRQTVNNPSNPACMRFTWRPATRRCDRQRSLHISGF